MKPTTNKIYMVEPTTKFFKKSKINPSFYDNFKVKKNCEWKTAVKAGPASSEGEYSLLKNVFLKGPHLIQ